MGDSQSPPQELQILLDVDEVLVDFIGGACKAHGIPRESFREAVYGTCVWDMAQTLGVSREAFWGPIDALGPTFWEQLEWLPWAGTLLALVDDYDWCLVTTPTLDPASRLGKRMWIANYFGLGFGRYYITQEKHLLAAPNRVLIDDSVNNLFDFRAAGGKGILFPSVVNELYESANNPVPYIKERLDAFVVSRCE